MAVKVWRMYGNGSVKDETHVLWPHTARDDGQHCLGYDGDVAAWSKHNRRSRGGCAQIVQRDAEQPRVIYQGMVDETLTDSFLREVAARGRKAPPLQHTVHLASNPGLHRICRKVCQLDVGEYLSFSRDHMRDLDIDAGYICGTPFDRVMGNIIGSAFSLTLRLHPATGEGTFSRVESDSRVRTYLDPDYRDGGPEDLKVVEKKEGDLPIFFG